MSSFLQTSYWAEFKGLFGWTSQRVTINYDNKSVDFYVLIRKIIGPYSIAYIPFGLGGSISFDQSFYGMIKKQLKSVLPSHVIFVRFDLDIQRSVEIKAFRKSPVDVQPPDTVILSLTNSEDEILSQMKKKTRYNIKLALKKGIKVVKSSIEELPAWYALYKETADRDKIAIHSYEYYAKQFELAELDKKVNYLLLLAYHEEDLLAGIILVQSGNRTTYLYGASSNEKRNLMPSYLLQWEGIKIAKNEWNCTEYDFFGIPPVDDPNHPMSGLYRFKVGFGGTVVHYHGCWDLPLKSLLYSSYRILEKMRHFYYKKIRKH
ncbi:lipid II:glycine glycyltransferase FemX [Spirochaeta cellobiosiphila]|uniref:lipid II:glycine glycyltransferase FemX n=1 Tax=Spirochaeta cellobiosiphila TaxID=504483 RepID=UPI000411A5D5|nr:peptidoglycan bridge formation glycyltransferase FemA/FemB family protein [Spirochaeta cellobiosiphila]